MQDASVELIRMFMEFVRTQGTFIVLGGTVFGLMILMGIDKIRK
jgi:hypothetical protein